MKFFLFKIHQNSTLFLEFFLFLYIFPLLYADAETLIIFENLKTTSFTEVSYSEFNFYSLSFNSKFNILDSSSSLVKLDPFDNIPIISTCNGNSIIGGDQIFGSNFDVLQISLPLPIIPMINRSYFEWDVTFDLYQFNPNVYQSMEVYITLSLNPNSKLLKSEIPGSSDYTIYCGETKISRFKYVSSASLSKTMYLVNDIAFPLQTLSYHTDIIRDAAFSPDGNYVASTSDDWTVVVYNLLTRQIFYTITHPWETIYKLSYSNNGAYLAISGWRDRTYIYEASTGLKLGFILGGGFVNFSYDDQFIIIVSNNDDYIHIHNFILGTKIRTIVVINSFFIQAFFSPDGSLIYAVTNTNLIKKWEISTGILLKEVLSPRMVLNLALSRNGSFLFIATTSNFDTGLFIYDTSTLKVFYKYESYVVYPNTILLLKMSANEDYILIALSDFSLRLLETWTGRLVRTFLGHSGIVSAVAISSSGEFILSGSRDNTLKLWKASLFSSSLFPLTNVGHYGLRNLEILVKFCDQTCEVCTGSASNCQICINNTIPSATPGKCTCPNGFFWIYYSSTNLKCQQCPENCLLCVENNCFSCSLDSFMTKEGECVKTCPSGWFPEGDFCKQCNESCKECTFKSNICSECASNQYLIIGRGICNPCIENCEICEGIDQCTKCVDDYFFNEELNFCQKNTCSDKCEVCEDLKICKKCSDGYYLDSINLCQKIKEISVTIKEIYNPLLFSIELGSFSSFIDQNLEKILDLFLNSSSANNVVNYWKIPWSKFQENTTNSSYLIMPIFKSSINFGSSLNFRFSINYSNLDSNLNSFNLSSNILSVLLYEYMPCNVLTEFYSNFSHSCIGKTKIIPKLLNTKNLSIFELNFPNTDSFEIFPYLVKNFSRVEIEGFSSKESAFKITQKSNNTFSIEMKYNKSIVLKPKLQFMIDIPIFYKLNNDFIVDKPEVSIDLIDYYILDKDDRSTLDDLTYLSQFLSYAQQALAFVVTIFTGSTSGLESLLLSNLILLFQYSQINYPTNLFEIFQSTLPDFPNLFFLVEFPVAEEDENLLTNILLFFEISPYFINNVGEELLRICVAFVISIFLHLLCEMVIIQGFIRKVLRYFRDFFIWQFDICLLFDSLINFVFFLSINIIFGAFSGFSAIFNYGFSIFMLFFVMYLLKIIYMIIEKCQNYRTKISELAAQKNNLKKIDQVDIILNEDKKCSKDNETINIIKLTPMEEKLSAKPQIKIELENLTFKKFEVITQVNDNSVKSSEHDSKIRLFFRKIGNIYNPNPEDYLKDFLFLHSGVKNEDNVRYFILFQTVLQLVIATVLGFTHNFPLVQMILVNLIFFWNIFITYKNKPYEEMFDFWMEIFNQIMTQIFMICVLVLAILDSVENEDVNLRIKIGWIAVAMILLIQYFGCLFNLINLLIFWKRKIVEYFEKPIVEKKEEKKEIIK